MLSGHDVAVGFVVRRSRLRSATIRILSRSGVLGRQACLRHAGMAAVRTGVIVPAPNVVGGIRAAQHDAPIRLPFGTHVSWSSASSAHRKRLLSRYRAYQRVCVDYCSRDHRFRRAAETDRRRFGSRPDGAFVRIDGADNFLRQEHGCRILCGASGLRRVCGVPSRLTSRPCRACFSSMSIGAYPQTPARG